jgi:hypothetical protein
MLARQAQRMGSALCVLVAAGCSGQQVAQHDGRADHASLRATAESTALPSGNGAAFEAAARSRRDSRQHLIEDWQIDDLKRAGLQDPVPMLVTDLERHPELIPYPGVLGGMMGFYDTTAIHVLDEQWVYAYFEDGHISGYGLFRYRVQPGGRIEWQRVAAHRDD